jgi:hypothetical protein
LLLLGLFRGQRGGFFLTRVVRPFSQIL